MPIKPPPFSGGATMFTPITYGPIQSRGMLPEEAFDRMLDAYAHNFSERARGPNYERPSQRIEINAIPVEDARRMFVDYVSYWERFYSAVSQALNDHMALCTSLPPIFMEMRKQDLRRQFSQGCVVHADRRSGKTAALFDEAEEVARTASCRVSIVSPRKEYIMAEACRRRMANAVPDQFCRLEFLTEQDIHKLQGLGPDVMVDEWFALSPQSRQELQQYRILAAVGTIPHGTRIPITEQARRNEDGYYGRQYNTFNPLAMARLEQEKG